MFTDNQYINRLDVKDFNFFGLPQKKSMKDYEEVYKKIRYICSNNKEILSVYTFGEVKVPGISDIDLIFVLKKSAPLPYFLRKTAIDSSSKYVLFHPFFIVSEELMQNIAYIYPNAQLRLIYGKKISIKKLSKPELSLVHQYLINDVILRHFPSDYLNVLLSKRINARMCLLRLNSLHHSFFIFEQLSGIRKKEWNEISNQTNELRKEWFNMPNRTAKLRLIELLKRAAYVSLDFVSAYSKFLKNKVPEIKTQNILFKGIQNRISFVDDWDAESSLSEMISHFNKYKNFYSVLPKVLVWQLCSYSSAQGALSAYISKRLRTKCNVKNLNPALLKRIQLLNYQVEYAMWLKHSHYPCFFPLGFKNTKGMKNKLIYTYVLIKDHSLLRKALHYIRANFRFMPI